MPETRCDYCQQLGSLAAGRQDRLLVARIVDWSGQPPKMVCIMDRCTYPMCDCSLSYAPADTKLRYQLTVHLKCIPSWLDDHPELALTSGKPSDL